MEDLKFKINLNYKVNLMLGWNAKSSGLKKQSQEPNMGLKCTIYLTTRYNSLMKFRSTVVGEDGYIELFF